MPDNSLDSNPESSDDDEDVTIMTIMRTIGRISLIMRDYDKSVTFSDDDEDARYYYDLSTRKKTIFT